LSDVLIPKRNEKDLEDVPKDLLAQVKVHPVETLEQVLAFAFAAPKKKTAKTAPPGPAKSGPKKSGKEKKPLRRRSSGDSGREKVLSL
jgi:ATP-dependent Lon protease